MLVLGGVVRFIHFALFEGDPAVARDYLAWILPSA